MSGSRKKAMGIAKGSGAKGSMGGRLGIVKQQPGMGISSRLGGRKQQMQMTFQNDMDMEQQQQQQPQSRADAEDSWGHDMFYKSGYASTPLGALELDRPGGNPVAKLKSISHRCHPILVAFVWELTE